MTFKFFYFVILINLFFTKTFSQSEKIYVAWWNVENLFDTIDHVDNFPQKGNDDEFTPNGKNKWTSERYFQKLENLSEIISLMNDENCPDILGICEVENESVLNDLIKKIGEKKSYKILYKESPDLRGIDVAFIYDSKKIEKISFDYRSINLGDSSLPTRDIVFAEFKMNEKNIIIIGNHWPSRRGGKEKSESKRIIAAQTLKTLIDSILFSKPNSEIISMGDFNDTPNDISIKDYLNASSEKTDLFNAMFELEEKNLGSYLYNNEWDFIDQMILTKTFFDNKNFEFETANVFKKDFMFETEGKFKGAPFRTYGGEKYLGGFSDHLPIYVILNLK